MARETATRGRADAWAYRWSGFAAPGRYAVTMWADHMGQFIGKTWQAVIDDFGNLVVVPA
jgi:hypothetical protein